MLIGVIYLEMEMVVYFPKRQPTSQYVFVCDQIKSYIYLKKLVTLRPVGNGRSW